MHSGILADEMGLGKTIQVSCVAAACVCVFCECVCVDVVMCVRECSHVPMHARRG